MTLTLFILLPLLLLVLLVWLLRQTNRASRKSAVVADLEQSGRRHVTYLSQIRQALVSVDTDYLRQLGMDTLARRVRKERSHVALAYLAAVRQDFQELMSLAHAIAVLSPNVAATHEYERLRIGMEFALRYQMIRLRLRLGFLPLPQLSTLGEMVSDLAVRMEAAMAELGERAALASDMASSLRGNH